VSSWVRLLGIEGLTGPAREAAESGRQAYGQLLETWRALFHVPSVFSAYLPFLRAVAGPGSVDASLKDLTAVLVGALNGCRYTVSHRTASARRNGVDDVAIIAAATQQWDAFEPATRAAMCFTRQVTLDPVRTAWSHRPQAVDDELLAEMKSFFTDQQLVELTLSIALWNALARFHRTMGFDLDMPVPPAAIDPAVIDLTELFSPKQGGQK
jgi:AhpD family alkylhydroperoxidase